jgi:hypothetical protein
VNFKMLRVGRNPDRGFGKRTRGGSRRIVGLKSSLIPNHLWPRPQSRGHVRSSPKVTSRGGLSEKGANAQVL